ncbi:hypothetical protein SAMN05443665_104220 [Actinomadura meyerae]|uniref:HEAT repeat n=1 Tax=Actinomadura meyerae TaxID=240840 RepID=A0A239NI11_9ACTN|nr:hypothetical protein [Actinomadura meyerae]SNT54526.1 hypothetical protein SAMN05443665_104220 [Actinomadura meyerae]
MIFRRTGGAGATDWASLQDACGPADDVPRLLRTGIGRDEGAAQKALSKLAGRLTHQGTLYPATAAAVPVLIELAASRRTRRRPELLWRLAVIAESTGAAPELLEEVRDALRAGARRLLKLHSDPDARVRRMASYVVGHLPADSVEFARLRKMRDAEGDDEAASELLLAAGALHPKEAASWLPDELAAGRPVLTRAAAAWSLAVYGESFGPAAVTAVRECWAKYDPLRDSPWSDSSLSEIISAAPLADAVELASAFLRDEPGENASHVVSGIRWRCLFLRSARTGFGDVLAEAVSHPDTAVRAAAAALLVEVRQPVPAAVDALADYVKDPPETALDDRRHWLHGLRTPEGRLLAAALRLLVMADHPDWRPAVLAAFGTGFFDGETVGLLAKRGLPPDPALLDVLRPHLASAAMETLMPHEPDVAIPALLTVWGPDAAAATPELAGFVPHERLPAVTALRAIGPGASAAVPALTEAVTGPGPWEFREACAEALTAITGESEHVTRFVRDAADAGETVMAAQLGRAHGLPLDDLLPALRELATTDTSDFTGRERRMAAAEIVMDLTGDTATALRAAEAMKADGDAMFRYPAALAIKRITGDTGPLLDATAQRLLEHGAGPWFAEAARELGDALEPLVPGLRRQAGMDRNTLPPTSLDTLIPGDLDQLAVLADVLAAWDGRDRPADPGLSR